MCSVTTAQRWLRVVKPTKDPVLFLGPGDWRWRNSNKTAGGTVRRAVPIERRAGTDSKKYDYIVLDTPPSLGILTVNALVASTHLIVPIQAAYFAIEGTDDLLETYERIRARPNPA